VSLNLSGLPSGAGFNFNPSSATGSGTSTLTITTAGSTPPGTYPITITGTSGSLVHSTSITLVMNSSEDVQDFTINAAPSSQTVVRGIPPHTRHDSGVDGFAGSLSFSVSGLPAATRSNFSPSSVIGSGTSTLTIITQQQNRANRLPTGTFPLTIRGTSGSLSHATMVTLFIN
jgi:hypothetical protein